MLGHNFYHAILKKNIALFGRLFDDIYITRTDADGNEVQKLRVPIYYGAKDKMLSRIDADPNIDRESAVSVPCISFEMQAPYRDPERQISPTQRITNCANTSDPNSMQTVYVPVPMIFPFTLQVYGNNPLDCDKIVEQIYPMFTPDFTLTVMPLSDFSNAKFDYPIVIGEASKEDSYAGSLTERRRVIWTFNFTMRGYMFGPVVERPLIKYVIGNAMLTGNDLPVATVTVQPGLTANGLPTSVLEDSIPVANINIDDAYGYVKIIEDPKLNE